MTDAKSESTERDRFYVQKDKHHVFQELSQGDVAPFKNMKDVWLLSAALGLHFSRRAPMKGGTQHIGFWHYLSAQEDIPMIQAIALAETGDITVLADRSRIIRITEEYANGGIALLADSTRVDRQGSLIAMAALVLKESNVERDRDTSVDDFIRLGESRMVEFKSSMKFDTKLGNANKELVREVVRTVAAFMNCDGGTLLIGVSDKGEVLGIEPDYKLLGGKGQDGFQQAFANAVRDHLGAEFGPLLKLDFSRRDGKTVAIVTCPPCHKPVFVKEGGSSEFYARSASASQKMDVQAANSYINSRWPDYR